MDKTAKNAHERALKCAECGKTSLWMHKTSVVGRYLCPKCSRKTAGERRLDKIIKKEAG